MPTLLDDNDYDEGYLNFFFSVDDGDRGVACGGAEVYERGSILQSTLLLKEQKHPHLNFKF